MTHHTPQIVEGTLRVTITLPLATARALTQLRAKEDPIPSTSEMIRRILDQFINNNKEQ